MAKGAGGYNLPAPAHIQLGMTDFTPRPGRTASWALLFLGLVLLSGCRSVTGPAPAQGNAPAPRTRVEAPSPPPTTPPDGPVPVPLEEESGPAFADAILESPWSEVPGMEEEVQRWIESFQTREASLFRETLVRMGRYQGMVEEEVRARQLPQSLVYLPIIESWYLSGAVSWVGAAGLWQFMPPTARGFGLQVDRLVDERRDPYRATPYALDFLLDLRERFGSWFLALAAYNGGPGRLQRVLRSRGLEGDGHDGVFQEVRGDLPRETRNFIPRFIAAARIGRDPEAYGFGDLDPDPPLAFDEVEVPDATTLDVVARAAEVSQEALTALNPQLLRGLTPAGVVTRIRVPPGTRDRFLEQYALIPPEERVTFVEHVVVQGETLSHIAQYYAVPVDDVRAANPRVEPRRMQIGQRIIVPKAPSVREGLVEGAGPAISESVLVVYTIRSGDTLGGIASRHGVPLGDLLRWNDLTMDDVIRPGDEVRIYQAGGS
jgi:membrane-bound lytic murein transglycosylase D